ncbi:MAG TPA: tetratricopeptide repeat protein, partial [Aquificae bacterium]|nr:tetratricopeptide repeat protein [Aquificota bacterium]
YGWLEKYVPEKEEAPQVVENSEPSFEDILETLKKKGKLSKEDLDYLFKMSQQENDEYEKYMKFYINKAIRSFNKAIKEFPDNPYPYIQLANFYKNSGNEKEAQKYLEKAAKLFLKYNQKDMYFSLLNQIKEEGYSSEFIKKLEGLLK